MGQYLPEKIVYVDKSYTGSKYGGYRVYSGSGQIRSGGKVTESWQPLLFVRKED